MHGAFLTREEGGLSRVGEGSFSRAEFGESKAKDTVLLAVPPSRASRLPRRRPRAIISHAVRRVTQPPPFGTSRFATLTVTTGRRREPGATRLVYADA